MMTKDNGNPGGIERGDEFIEAGERGGCTADARAGVCPVNHRSATARADQRQVARGPHDNAERRSPPPLPSAGLASHRPMTAVARPGDELADEGIPSDVAVAAAAGSAPSHPTSELIFECFAAADGRLRVAAVADACAVHPSTARHHIRRLLAT